MHRAILPTLTLALGVVAGSHLPDIFAVAVPVRAAEVRRAPDLVAPYRARQNIDVTGRAEIPCPAGGVTLILGQSNAANYAGERVESKSGAVDRLGLKCYRAAGPTLGSDGIGGSVWPLVGDLLGQPMQFVGLAFGGTTSSEWADPQRLGGMLAERLSSLQADGVTVERVVWHQGESDYGTEPAIYAANLRHVIDQVLAAYPDAKFFVAQTSYCAGILPGHVSRAPLLEAQASLVDDRRVFAGPNTDRIAEFSDRFDGCHFSGLGLRREAAAWVESIKSAGSPGKNRGNAGAE